jgi:signal peptidase
MIFGGVLLLILSHFISVWLGNPSPISVVTSGSMEPTLYKGDIIVWAPADIDSVAVGDIIVFQSSVDRTKIVSHRVINITLTKTGPRFTTKGDANEYPDQKGSRAIEPYIGKEQYYGKVVSTNQQPLKIPYIGNIIFLSDELVKEFVKLARGESKNLLVLIIFIIVIAIAVCIISLYISATRKRRDIDFTELIFGPVRVRARRIMVYTLIAYSIFLLFTSLFAYDTIGTSVNINMNENPPETPLDFGDLKEGEVQDTQLPIINPYLMTLKGIVFSKGNISDFLVLENTTFLLKSGERHIKNITIHIPPGTTRGTYVGKIYIYSSPYWVIFPDSFMNSLAIWNPSAAVIIFNVISALFLSAASVIILYVLSRLIDASILLSTYLSWHPILRFGRKYKPGNFFLFLSTCRVRIAKFLVRTYNWCFYWLMDLGWVDIRMKKPFIASLTGLFFIPLIFWGKLFLGFTLAAFFAGAVAYVLGCRWRAEIITSSILSATYLFISFSLLFISLSERLPFLAGLALAAEVISAFLFIFVLILLPTCLLSYLASAILQWSKERLEPQTKIEGDSDI